MNHDIMFDDTDESSLLKDTHAINSKLNESSSNGPIRFSVEYNKKNNPNNEYSKETHDYFCMKIF